MKKCTKCLQIKPYDQFYRDKHTFDGYTARCRDCLYAAKERRPIAPDGYKYCYGCNQMKPVNEFYMNRSNLKDGRAYRCKVCTLEERKGRIL